MVVYQKASVGVYLILLYLFKEKKISEIKRRKKFLKEKKNRKERKKNVRKRNSKNRVIVLFLFSIKGWRRIRKLFRV